MCSFLHGLLILSVGVVYGLGPKVIVEFAHTHAVLGEHEHAHSSKTHERGHGDFSHDHHSHDHDSHRDHQDPAQTPDDSPEEDPGGTSHQHSHIVSLGTDIPMIPGATPQIGMVSLTSVKLPCREPDICPDDPYFPLIKPPQLG